MGPKYEFTGETKLWGDSTLHRIRRLRDGKLGGWIESEDNLSQEGNCWVDDDAMVADSARVYGNAKVSLWAKVYNNAQVYGNANVSAFAEVYDNAKVYGGASVYGNAKVHVNTEVRGYAKVDYDLSGTVGEALANEFTNENTKVLKDFVYKIDDSSKLDVQSSYDSVDAFFEDNSNDSYVEHECLTIVAVDTKVPILKFEKTQVKDQNVFKFIVDITNDNGDNYSVKAIIETKYKFDQLLKSTIDSLKNYPQFNKYANDLENCL